MLFPVVVVVIPFMVTMVTSDLVTRDLLLTATDDMYGNGFIRRA